MKKLPINIPNDVHIKLAVFPLVALSPFASVAIVLMIFSLAKPVGHLSSWLSRIGDYYFIKHKQLNV